MTAASSGWRWQQMANKTFSVPITDDSVFQAAATASGSVSGDTTTITSIALNVPDDMWALAVGPDNFPKVTIIDGKQYRWTIKAKKTTLGVTYVQKATLNIGTKLVINKPFFTIKYGENPVSDPSECVRSFYDLGRLTYYGWDPGASDIEITGNESVQLNVESGDDSTSIKLTTDATYRFTWTLKNKTYSNTKKLAAKATRITNSYKIPKLWNEELPSSTYGWMDLKIERGRTVERRSVRRECDDVVRIRDRICHDGSGRQDIHGHADVTSDVEDLRRLRGEDDHGDGQGSKGKDSREVRPDHGRRI